MSTILALMLILNPIQFRETPDPYSKIANLVYTRNFRRKIQLLKLIRQSKHLDQYKVRCAINGKYAKGN